MFRKMYWLSSRRRLLILTILDYFAINIIFIILQNKNLISSNWFSVNVLAFVWILLSYIFDKYSIINNPYEFKLVNNSLRIIKIAIISSVIFRFLTIFFSLFNYFLENIVSVNYISLILLISFIIEIIYFSILKRNKPNPIKWISIYKNKTSGSLFSRFKYVNDHGFIMSIHVDDLKETFSEKSNNFGLIIEDINLLNNKEKMMIFNLQNQGFQITTMVDWLDRYLHRYPVDFVSSDNILSEFLIYKQPKISKRIKRFSEFILSFLLLIISLPVTIIAAILIKIEDGGPIIYSQERTGFSGIPFRIYKLRSMKINAEKDGIKWSSLNDKRITFIGNIIRKSRIDELPQLISVLKGDMSLIGPRPERPEIDKSLSKEIVNYKLRYLVRPGLSGWAQVNYPYGASINDTKMKFSYDMYYIRNFSTLFDILILFKTIRLVFNLRGSQPQSTYEN